LTLFRATPLEKHSSASFVNDIVALSSRIPVAERGTRLAIFRSNA